MKRKTNQYVWFYIMIGPAIFGFFIFTLGPMITSLYLSFTKYDVVNPPQWIGLNNYIYLIKMDPAFWTSIKVTLIFAAVQVPLMLITALSTALLLNNKVKFLGIFRTIYFLPSLLPATASGVLWVWIFNPNFGLLNKMLAIAGVNGPAWTLSTTWALPALILMGLWGFGGEMIIFLAGLQDIPEVLYEAADIDGASSLSKFKHITFPMITPVFFFNLVMGVIGAMKVFDQAYVFGATGGAGPGGPARATLFYVLNLYQKSFTYFHMGLGSAMAWLLFVMIIGLTYINFKLAKKWVHYGGN